MRRLLPLLAALAVPTLLAAQVPDTPATPAVIDSATLRAARTLLIASHAAEGFRSGAERLLQAIRNARGGETSSEITDRFLAALRADTPQLMEEEALVYARHFTREELEGLTRFYESPLGQALLSRQDVINAESMEIGQRWGVALARRIMDSLPPRGTPPTLVTPPGP